MQNEVRIMSSSSLRKSCVDVTVDLSYSSHSQVHNGHNSDNQISYYLQTFSFLQDILSQRNTPILHESIFITQNYTQH
jgi:hypothetical protein